jgi:hypothetical protein
MGTDYVRQHDGWEGWGVFLLPVSGVAGIMLSRSNSRSFFDGDHEGQMAGNYGDAGKE